MHCRAPQALLVHSVTQRFGSDADLTPRWLGGQESTCQKPETGDAGSIPGREDPLEEEMTTHSRILAWGIPWTEEPGRLQSTGLQRVGHG